MILMAMTSRTCEKLNTYYRNNGLTDLIFTRRPTLNYLQIFKTSGTQTQQTSNEFTYNTHRRRGITTRQ